MRRLELGIVLHNHQPVGNYGFVIAEVFRSAYAPMLAALERHPGVRVAMHHSGPLLDWLGANEPRYIDRLALLCARGQVEPVSGGYYEPILPMINDADKLGQIRKLNDWIEHELGQRATGAWLAERVWEPGLPGPLAGAGIDWTLVDDAHFRMAGVPQEDLDGYFLTEDQGRRIKLFAGSQFLRYAIPWTDVDALIEELRARARGDGDVPYLVLGDDGEKFGAWPTTFAHVWDGGWIERFFTALERESAWLVTVPPGEIARTRQARGLAYLPAASYAEMMEWALPAEASAAYARIARELEHDGRVDVQRFLRGGFWRSFLAKYPEVNAMHKRGARIAVKLGTRGGEAREALWAAQCNCPYWHGVFGGIYLRNVRAATLANLVRAERLAAAAGGKRGISFETADHDYDGTDDLLAQTPALSLLVQPGRGGAISEWDLRQRDHALLGVVARWREAYHEALLSGDVAAADAEEATNIHGGVRVKEAGLREALAFDAHPRIGAQDWVIGEDVTVAQFAARAMHAAWTPEGAWRCDVERTRSALTARLEREHDGWRIEKAIEVAAQGEQLELRYTCANVSSEHRRARLISEWNLSLPHAADGDDRIAVLECGAARRDLASEGGAFAGPAAFVLRGSAPYALRCAIAGAPCDVWHYPVTSISSSEGGLERVFQGVAVGIAAWLDLEPGAAVSFSYRWETEEDAPTAAAGR